MIYNKLFCSTCKDYGVHYWDDIETAFVCIKNHEKDVCKPWSSQRSVFQAWLANLTTRQILDVVEDVNKMIEYKYRVEHIESLREQFNQIMKGIQQ